MLTSSYNIDSSLEDIEYGSIYATYIKDFFMSKTSKDRIIINLTNNRELETELYLHFRDHAQIPIETKDMFSQSVRRVIDLSAKENIDDLIESLEEHLNTADRDVTFYIFGTTKFEHGTFKFHKMIKKYNNITVTIRHG